MAEQRKDDRDTGEGQRHRDTEQAQKIPPNTQASQEWGERTDDGRVIATGGKTPPPAEGGTPS